MMRTETAKVFEALLQPARTLLLSYHLVALVATILIVALLIPVLFLVWIAWAWKTQEGIPLPIDADAELRRLYADYCTAAQEAIDAAQAATKPLDGEALRRFSEEIRTTRPPKGGGA
jgi:hypothetical protein